MDIYCSRETRRRRRSARGGQRNETKEDRKREREITAIAVVTNNSFDSDCRFTYFILPDHCQSLSCNLKLKTKLPHLHYLQNKIM